MMPQKLKYGLSVFLVVVILLSLASCGRTEYLSNNNLIK